jgi:glycosyltransferase involved in cell wall biosynthesis
MKIFHLITDLNTGGAETSLYRLLGGMERAQFESQVVSLIPPGPLGKKIAGLGIRVRNLGMTPGRPTLAALTRLTGWLRTEQPDLLQTWLYHADLLGLLAARMAGVRRVVWNLRNSEMELSQYRRLSGLVVRACAYLSPFPQAVICNSRAGQEFHTRFGYHPRRWVVIPNGIDTRAFHPEPEAYQQLRRELGLPLGVILIGQVARYDPMKDQACFLKAAGTLLRSGSPAHFVLIGEGVTDMNPALTEIIRSQGLAGRVHLLGRQDDISRYEAALDVFASASAFGEGFPNVVAEAMACGIPCVVTDVGDSAFLVGGTGLVVPPQDPAALAAAWQKLLSSGEAARRELGALARKRVEENFSIEKTLAAYQKLYLGLVRDAQEKAV